MSFFNQKSNIVFSVVIFILVAVIGVLGYGLYSQKSKYVQTSASLSDNEALLEAAEEKIANTLHKFSSFLPS